jgi:predicted PurR-regulated permease PerM
MTELPAPRSDSPRWNSITKLTISLTLIVIVGALLIRFRGLIGPIVLAFVLAYLLHPVIAFITRKTPFSWKLTVSLVYLLFVAILIALLTWGGVALVGQAQKLVETIQNNIDKLPDYIEQISQWQFELGPLKLDFSQFDWGEIGNQVLGYVEPALGQIGSVIGSVASGAASTIGWIIFIIIISYFFLFESGGLRDRIIQVNIPLYAEDVRKMGHKLTKIWKAFLRGQAIIFFLTALVYLVFLSIMGVRYALVLALTTGFATFIPYVGPAINWIILGLVTYFQPDNMYGVGPFAYMAIVIAGAILIDQIFNNLVNPRVMANALKVHPAFVLIAALLAANLVGLIGVIIAAPLLATVILVGTYVVRKMLDRDPWMPEEKIIPPPPLIPGWLKNLFNKRPSKKESTRKISSPGRGRKPAWNNSNGTNPVTKNKNGGTNGRNGNENRNDH